MIFEFLHLDYVKFNIKNKSVTCIQLELMMNVIILKVCSTLIFKVNYGGQVTYISHIEISNIGYVQIDTNIVSLSRIKPMMSKGQNK